MRIISPINKIRWAVMFSFTGLLLAGCSTPYHAAAPISSVNDSQGQSNQGRSSQPSNTEMASTGGASTPMPSSRPDISANRPASSAELSNMSPQERIIYNRNYGNIQKGSYNGETYTVKRGDTLFYIAWITSNDYRELAQRNNIAEPYSLNVGQVVNIGGSGTGSNGQLAMGTSNNRTESVDSRPVNAYPNSSGGQSSGKMLPNNKPTTTVTTTATAAATVPSTSTTKSSGNTSSISWRWPTEGKMIDTFSDAQGGNKGVDIAGSRGQPIFATAPGKVVYAGNVLRGYGNLIIIKHNDDYLSAYAHNDTMLVRDQQDVQAGQKIATMGSTGTSSVRLHFEIRYKGKSVNPLRFLPQR